MKIKKKRYLLEIIHAAIDDTKHGGIYQASDIIATGTKTMQHVTSLHSLIGSLIMRMLRGMATNISW